MICKPQKSLVMKNTLHIKATIDEESFLEDMVEKLALRHNNTGCNKQKNSENKNEIETSSTETYASGTIAIESQDEELNIPFITSFLFTCIKETEDTYSLEWGISMS
jgi:hypothetical protein